MRILHVVPTYLPARRYGGPIVAVHGLCAALAARGHDVHVFTTNVDGPDVSAVTLDAPVALDGVQVHYFPSSFPRLYWSPPMREALAKSVAGFDVVHNHSVFLWPTAAAASAARRAKVPYLIAPRGMLVKELIRAKSTLVKTAWLTLVERRNFAHACAIHFTSQREWDDAKEVGMPLPSPVVVPNGIDLPPLVETPRDPATILFLGRLTWKKGIDRLIEAMPLLPDARLTIAGNDEEGYAPRLRELIDRLGVAGRIRFLGHVAGEAKQALLRRATVFALPSISENFGNVVVEAMAAATPVVITAAVGLAPQVARARAGIVVQSNGPRELAEAIGALIRGSERRAEMGARGRKLVEERFAWPRVAQEMEEAYRCTTASRP